MIPTLAISSHLGKLEALIAIGLKSSTATLPIMVLLDSTLYLAKPTLTKLLISSRMPQEYKRSKTKP